jgi:hypothetical protein
MRNSYKIILPKFYNKIGYILVVSSLAILNFTCLKITLYITQIIPEAIISDFYIFQPNW